MLIEERLNWYQRIMEGRLSRRLFTIFALFFICSFIFCYLFVWDDIIGKDYRYWLYIWILPVTTGGILLGVYRKEFIMAKYSEVIGRGESAAPLFLLSGIICLMLSFLSVGFASNSIWHYYARQAARYGVKEMIEADVTGFVGSRKKGGREVQFQFRGGRESISTDFKDCELCESIAPGNLSISLQCRPTLWGYYLVDSWMVVEKN